MKRLLLSSLVIALVINAFSFSVLAHETRTKPKIYTLYLIRHAEKATDAHDNKDPLLSECGTKRAKSLVNMFKDIELDAIYSSDYIRTQMTAKPVAMSKDIEVTGYNPRDLPSFSLTLIQNKQNALVIGHSNTTNVLAGYLSEQTLAQIDEQVYDRIYQVTIIEGSSLNSHLQILHQTYNCV